MNNEDSSGAAFPISEDGAQGDSAREESFPQIEGYEITAKLGEGGMGTVWKAMQLSTRREVALKLLGARTFGSERARLRFEREVELAARLEHPNIARIYDSGVRQGVYYYAMELIAGVPLDEYVQEHKLTQRQILELMRTGCQAVQHAHQRGVIHRDLKPSNILVTKDGQPHVLDFGLAKAFLEEDDKGITVSMDGEVAGTPEYMSPEQAGGRLDEVAPHSDVYSLGVISYRLLTGQSPHDLSGTRYEILHRIAQEEAMRLRDATRDVDRELDALVHKALAHEPQDRYVSAGEFARDIDNYLTGKPVTAKPATVFYRLRKAARRHRRSIVAGSIVAALVVAGLVNVIVFARKRDAPTVAPQESFKGTFSRKRGGILVEWLGSVVVTAGDGSAELTNIACKLGDREVTFSFDYRVWNDKKTPWTQLHIMRGGRVIESFYNGVPPRSPGDRGNKSVTVPVPYGTVYNMSLCLTLAWNMEQGKAHAEQPGGHKTIFARIESSGSYP